MTYNPTEFFVRTSIEALEHTIFEAIALVVLVVIVFLQNGRATIIPLLAIPVSLVGTFAAMAALGYTINTLTLFGLVLAVGIVVDDAIVVVENVERYLRQGLSPKEAAHKTMDEVGGALISIALGADVGVRADHVPRRHLGRVLPPVRRRDLGRDADLGLQLAVAEPGAGGPAAQGRMTRMCTEAEPDRPRCCSRS